MRAIGASGLAAALSSFASSWVAASPVEDSAIRDVLQRVAAAEASAAACSDIGLDERAMRRAELAVGIDRESDEWRPFREAFREAEDAILDHERAMLEQRGEPETKLCENLRRSSIPFRTTSAH